MKIVKEKLKKSKQLIVQNRIILILSIVIILIVIVGGIGVYRAYFKDDNSKKFSYEDIDSIDELPEEDKKILGISDEKNEIEKEEEKKYISKEYNEYEKLSKEEKAKIDSIPRKEEIPKSEINVIKEDIEYNENDGLPSKFNLADTLDLKVEDQENFGLCWAFASLNSLETNAALHEGTLYDFSEIHLDMIESNLMYGTRDVHEGGYFSLLGHYSSLFGATLEKEYEYGHVEYYKPTYMNYPDKEIISRVTDYVEFPAIRKENGEPTELTKEEMIEERKLIKTHIMKNGSLYASIKSSTSKNIYNSNNSIPGHAVSIVGWDDNYKKENFKSSDNKIPKHDGAYIVLNSWGKGYGDGGYHYISYDDTTVELNLSGVTSTSMENAYKLNDITNAYVKNYIEDNLKYYILNYDGEEYITKNVLNNVYSLELSNKNMTSEDLVGFEIFSKVYYIDLSGNNITDVSYLTNFSRLSILDLTDNSVSDVSVLASLENLGVLNLNSNKNVKGFEKITNLYSLGLSNCKITDFNIGNNVNLNTLNLSYNENIKIEALPNSLFELYLDKTNFNDFKALSNLDDLYTLSLRYNNLTNLDGIENLKSLYNLDISNNMITNIKSLKDFLEQNKDKENVKDDSFLSFRLTAQENNIKDISIFNDLKIQYLDLSNNMISDLSNFSNKNLDNIILANNQIFKGIKNLKDIKSINLSNTGITTTSELASLGDVEYLYLDNNKITSLSDIAKLKKLYYLNVNNNNIESLPDLSALENLATLSLNNNINLKDITPLNKIKYLSTLSLSGNTKITGKLNNNLYTLDISNTNIGNDFDLTGLDKLFYLDVSNNTSFTDYYSLLKNYKSDFFQIEAHGIEITKEQAEELANKIKGNDEREEDSLKNNWNINGVTIVANYDLDENNTIDIEEDYDIRTMLMNLIGLNFVYIDNGYVEKNAKTIKVYNLNSRTIEIDLFNAYGNISVSKLRFNY